MSTPRVALVSLLAVLAACILTAQAVNGAPLKVISPDGQITLLLSEAGSPAATADPTLNRSHLLS